MKRRIAVICAALGLVVFSFAFAGQKFISHSTAEKKGTRMPATDKPAPVIVELFTSEGCSSCPPADELLTRLDKSQPVPGAEIIVLAEHVDYWNRLGWTDPYSSAEFSRRQGEYARAFGRDGVYTPQMIVDGQTEFPGGNRNKAYEAIAKATRTPKAFVQIITSPQSVEEKKTDQMRLAVRVEKLPAVGDGDTAEVLLAITENNLSTNVPRGENAGRRLSHVGVVRQFNVIGSMDTHGTSAFKAEPIVALGRGLKRENLRAVVFVQERASRRVLGAAVIRLMG